MSRKFSLIAVTLWVGGLWVTGISAYTLFQILDDRTLAGNIAGALFTNITYIGLACGVYLLIQRVIEDGPKALKQGVFWIVLVMLALVIAGQLGIQPILAHLKQSALPSAVMDSVYAKQFGMWHGVSGVLYLVECLLGVLLLFKVQH